MRSDAPTAESGDAASGPADSLSGKRSMSYTWLVSSGDHVPFGSLVIGDVLDIDLSTVMPGKRVTSVRIRRVMVPDVAYNVVLENQRFIITIGGVDYIVTVPVGYYKRDELVATVNAALTAALALTLHTAAFTYNSMTFCAPLVVRTGGVAVAYSVDIPPSAVYRPAPSMLKLLGIDDRVLPIAYDPLVPAGPLANPGPVNSTVDRFALITCDQAHGLRGELTSLSANLLSNPTRYPWHNGIVSIFPLELPKGQVTSYVPDNDAPWVHIVRSEANMILRFRLNRQEYERFGPMIIEWSMLLEVTLG